MNFGLFRAQNEKKASNPSNISVHFMINSLLSVDLFLMLRKSPTHNLSVIQKQTDFMHIYFEAQAQLVVDQLLDGGLLKIYKL